MSKTTSTKKKSDLSANQALGSFIKNNKEDHYNLEPETDYLVSSGSLTFDHYLDGGFGPGLHRFVGQNEGGKTSQALEVMKNFLHEVPNSRGIYIKAEGRLSKQMRDRSGIEFTKEHEDWKNGNCFIYESNIYESVASFICHMIDNNDENLKYCIILDSVDGLIPKGDYTKSFEESAKVAGGAVIAANLLKQTSIKLGRRGHMALFISQVRADIKIDMYTKTPVRQTTATGGNALLHFADYIIQFEPRHGKDYILQNPSNKKRDDKTNPAIGHYAKAIIKKSPNEKTNTVVKYPIKYGRKNGTSIWVEMELIELLQGWQFIEKSGAWITVTEEFKIILEENGFSLPGKIQGESKLFSLIEEDKELCKFLLSYFRAELKGAE